MEHFLERIKNAKQDEIIPVYKVIDGPIDSVEFFAKLSDYGRKSNSILLESADIIPKYGELSIGSASPCLKLTGLKEDFEIKALNQLGKKLLKLLKNDLSFCDKIIFKQDLIKGKLAPKRKNVSEEERLKLKTHIDIIKALAFKFKPTEKPFIPYCGLFGAISYDFIDQFEDLPQNKEDLLQNPDYELYFLDNLFLADHKKGKTYFIANALITDNNRDEIYKNCIKTISNYEKALTQKPPKPKKFKPKKQELSTDTTKEEYEEIVSKMKTHILQGDIFQVVPSRTIIADYNAEPLDIYQTLRKLNPSPYMFFMNQGKDILLGASPEMSLRVQGDEKKTVEIRPIAGTKPRGLINEKIDLDLDSRYETELKIDEKELAEHTMLIDLARNDVAKISETGTRFCNEPFVVEKYSHVQHLVSNVTGILKKDLDALHAYLATMNMGTLTGCPKVEAMKLIRAHEKNKRGFYGGAVGYITPNGDMDTTIVIRSMFLKNNKAYIRAGAGIVYDSIPENEFIETEKKAKACLKAITLAGGLK
ncbi:MAG: anthranilate synthase component 1 [Nanoarchaeota archaeon]|nr:anthranilate synthase component 1 [Nanoarchaeota archaeon]MBU1005301.1 anthranilate synthase component 1 [Nanoarchaeota archaeon]MBU1946368.1 anthranilate synthase component 1 [Nanoarchaeota archaeon]